MECFANFLLGFQDLQSTFVGFIIDFWSFKILKRIFSIFSDFKIFNLMILIDFFKFLWVFKDLLVDFPRFFFGFSRFSMILHKFLLSEQPIEFFH